jgi:hypothetical protein
VGKVARMVGYSKKWTREIARRYESEGVEGLGDRRHGNPGAKERGLCSTRRPGKASGGPPKGGPAGRRDVERA